MTNQEFGPIFSRLRDILHKHSNILRVSADRPDYYCMDVEFSPKLGKSFPVGWVKTGKNYVSYQFMPVYMFPRLKEGFSGKLKKKIQGKSCFNFKVVDDELLGELDRLTVIGLRTSREKGFAPERE